MPPPRGEGPLISVLMPTRKRVLRLAQSLRHFYQNTHDKGLVEFIFKVDDDDQETLSFLQQARAQVAPMVMTVTSGPRGRGYLDMHQWINQMTTMAKGDWLFVANDDACLISYGWDQLLLNYRRMDDWHQVEEMSVLGTYVNHVPAEAFLLVRKEFVQVVGHFARHHLVDNYIWKVAKFCESAHHIPIHFWHAAREDVQDETGMDVLAAHKTPDGHARVTSSELAQWRLEDAAKVISYLKSRGA